MNEVINLADIRKKKIEEKAYEKYKAIKIGEDSYLIPANNTSTAKIDYSFKNNPSFTKEQEEIIKALKVEDYDAITVNCKRINGDLITLEILNVTKKDVVEIEVTSKLEPDDRDEIINEIAAIHSDKRICVVFFINYNYEVLKELVEEGSR